MATTAPVLPAELAPDLRQRVADLLRQVALVPEVPRVEPWRPVRVHRCIVCYRGGVLGGHHDADGRVVWVHRSCHRRLHRRGRGRGGRVPCAGGDRRAA